MHEFYYEQSNQKVGASENNLQFDIKVNKKEIFNKNYLENNSEKDIQLSIKKYWLFENLKKSNIQFKLTTKIIHTKKIIIIIEDYEEGPH